MEQLDSIAYEFSAFVRGEAEALTEFSFVISKPRDSGEGDSVCAIACPFLRAEPFQIYGGDDDQALELSLRFIEVNLEHRNLKLVNERGQPVELPPLSIEDS